MTNSLEDLCYFINGGAWSDKEYAPSGIPVLKVSNMQGEGIYFDKVDYIPKKSRDKYSKHILVKDDLVIATVGSHPNLVNSAAGRATIIPKKGRGFLLNQNAVCLRTKDATMLDQKYLAYIGKTSEFQHFIQQRGRGAANQMRIAIGAIKEYQIRLPSIGTQRRIASILSSYDDLIENNIQRIQLLEETAQRTYEEWFVKFRVNGEELAINEETGLPDGWENVPLSQFIRFQKGKKATIVSDEYQEEFEKLLLLDGMESGKYLYTHPSNQIIAESGDLLMLMDGARSSKVFFVERGVVGSTLAKIVIEGNNIPSSLLKHYFEANFDRMQINNTGSAIPHANKSFINAMLFTYPKRQLVEKWKVLIEPMYLQIRCLKGQILLLKQSHDILLPRLMNGTISVGQAEESLSMAAEREATYQTVNANS